MHKHDSTATKELTNKNVTWEQRKAIFFLNKLITFKNRNNNSQQNWEPRKVRCVVILSVEFRSKILYVFYTQFRF